MALPLQPDLRPWPIWQRRIATACAVILSIVALGVIARPSRDRARLVVTGERAFDSYPALVGRLIEQAQTRVWVMVFVLHPEDGGSGPVHDLVAALGAAKARGVDVRFVLDLGKTWGTDTIDPKHEAASALLEAAGVPVIIDEIERTTHAKIVLVDDRHAVLGSHNWTRSAFVRNREVSVYHQDANLIAELEPLFEAIPGFKQAGH
ncbi:MAG: phospholipase D-like domain-containing protein [Planctomycetota bacterium]|jgi:phosphatidylserine/phosphatidylglycerophosphate/cardiolipin synthase-like enzyme|nr:phospholipase D-like domain-containing protein [Planctomycetota bacterium]